MDENGVIYKHQSGFRTNILAKLYLVHFTDFTLRVIGKSFYSGIIPVDMKKNLDTLQGIVLSQKMKCMGFKESVIKWF